MSDIRTKLLMGTTISAVSLMLVMAIGITSEQNSGTAGTALAMMGHFEIMVVNPDGTTSYTQSDNFISGAAKTDVATAVFEGAALAGTYDCVILGTGTPIVTTDGVLTALGDTGVKCTDDVAPAGAEMVCNGLGNADGTAEQCVATTKHIMDATDCDPCTITEAAIGVGVSGAADIVTPFAFTALTASVVANAGAEVTTTYKIATGGIVT